MPGLIDNPQSNLESIELSIKWFNFCIPKRFISRYFVYHKTCQYHKPLKTINLKKEVATTKLLICFKRLYNNCITFGTPYNKITIFLFGNIKLALYLEIIITLFFFKNKLSLIIGILF